MLSNLVFVCLTTSMYFDGIKNDDSFGTYKFSLYITWWRFINSPDILGIFLCFSHCDQCESYFLFGVPFDDALSNFESISFRYLVRRRNQRGRRLKMGGGAKTPEQYLTDSSTHSTVTCE